MTENLKKQLWNDCIQLYNLSSNSKITDADLFKKIAELDKKYSSVNAYYENVLSNIALDQKSEAVLKHIASRIKKKGIPTGKIKYNYYYDIANTLCNLEDIRYSKNPNFKHLVDNAKNYSEILKLFSSVKKSKSDDMYERANTNTANILEKYGRNYEALNIYDRVLRNSPNFGMALGNKARALEYYYKLSPYKSLVILSNIKELYQKALTDKSLEEIGGKRATEAFGRRLGGVSKSLGKRSFKQKELPKLTKYQNFVIKNNMFLNYDLGYYYDKQSLRDDFFPNFIEKSSEKQSKNAPMSERIYYLWHIFNQIFEDYTTARFHLFQSLNIRASNIDKNIRYVNVLDYTVNSLKYGIQKSVFSLLYNCLDKVAHLVKYCFINNREFEDTYFKQFFSSDEFAKIVIKEKNYQLLALRAISLDFNEGNIYHNLGKIRNRITHSFVNVNIFDTSSENDFSEDELFELTKELFQVVKAVIMYSMIAINTSRNTGTDISFPKIAHFQKTRRLIKFNGT